MEQQITREIAAKVLSVVDAGLVRGMGVPVPGEMCVEAAVCYALGLPHGDDPPGVSTSLRALKIRLSDSNWSSNKTRAAGLRRLALAALDSAGHLDDKEFAKRVTELVIRKQLPAALRVAASVQRDHGHKAKLLDAAAKCEKEGTPGAAAAATSAAFSAASSAQAAGYAASIAANYAVVASYGTPTYAAANAASNAAYAAATAAYAAAKNKGPDESLAGFAEDVVQILVEMKVPGVQWLDLAAA